MNKIITFFEKKAFGVCTALGNYMGISITTIRLYFIYASFLTFGSPLIVYLGMAFWLNIRRSMRRRRQTIWY
ncbi:PspC domain-containing protein [Cesiribacter andamanensis]|uniref:Phage shock protein C n=1 Tax=Cesiribacter andamanensis AMV16 TaxID=1279009 RepID=M7NXS9_9BACT|nr:PspC domain-containing protein [Cesiribacter andamanensis]EMR03189.1 phage shock protein C [Cesiribacter andamanensis AMV16]